MVDIAVLLIEQIEVLRARANTDFLEVRELCRIEETILALVATLRELN